MYISIIACRVLNRELSALVAVSPHCVDVHWLPQGLHDVPTQLNSRLKAALAEIQEDVRANRIKHTPDAIVLGYGLCSNGVIGLESGDIPLVVPRTDDCIALLLGSQHQYMKAFRELPGTYWLSSGWIEACGVLVDTHRNRHQRWLAYAERFGEEEADYLIEQESLWMEHYQTCAYIRCAGCDRACYREQAQEVARENGWQYQELPGDLRMLEMMVSGAWNEQEFLIVPPNHRIVADYSGLKMRAVPLEGGNME